MTTQAMLKFISLEKRMPHKRQAAKRRGDFAEIYDAFDAKEAKLQAGRCSQCGVPFCQTHCPLQNNIPDWLMLTAENRLEEAYALASATNTFPEICGRICPQDRLCEGNCVIEKGFESVTIGAVEKHITETAFAEGWVKPPAPQVELPQSVGIIGAGPAGLAAADMLRRYGYQVTIYDRYDRVGGLMIYGIPNFKLEKQVVARREELLRDGGVTFALNTTIGETLAFSDLRQKHHAILIATGVYKSRTLDLAIGDGKTEATIQALDYLTTSNRVGLGDKVADADATRLNAKGKRVVVIGGGDTAMDCVRTAVRQEAKSVVCVYRRDRTNMPGSAREVHHAEEEGVRFEWLAQPVALTTSKTNGKSKISGLVCQRNRLGLADASGRQSMEAIADSEFTLKTDMVITALGFEAEDLPSLFHEPRLKLGKGGTVAIDWRTLMTELDGVFAAGDIVRGASLVVWAVRDGRDAANSIADWLESKAAATELKEAYA